MISALFEEVPATRTPPFGGTVRSQLAKAISSEEPSLAEPDDEDVFIFPVTAAQKRFWLLDQLVPGGNSALNIPLAVRLRGALDVRALERAFNEILRRHESLRTTFHCDKGQLLQVITPRQMMSVPMVDVSDFPPEERAHVPAHLLAEEARRPFDLARGPLLRARLVRFSPCEHLLLFPTHHIIADGWSNGVFVRELGALYAAYAEGRPSPLPELAIQFADFSQWQSTVLAEGGFDPQLDYWRERLAGQLPVLDLPVDRPRLPWRAAASPAEVCEHRLSDGLVSRLKALALGEGVSPFMLFLAVFTVLLNRYGGGQEDVLVGTSTANRTRLEVENLIGLFVNPLLLRLDLSAEPSFRVLLAQVRQVVLEAFEHADAPFEKLVEELQPRRLQVNFLYQQDFVQATRWHDLEVIPENAGTGGAVYEWNVLVLEDVDGVRLHCEYNAELFDAATVERMLTDFEGLLKAVASPDALETSIARLPLLSVKGADAGASQTLHAEPWRVSSETVAWMADHLAPAASNHPDLRQPLAGRTLRVLDVYDQPAPIGVPGELCVLTTGDAPPLRTGDMALVRADGGLEWIAPSGAECKVNGLRVDRRKVEGSLRLHPHLRQVAVVWRDDAADQPVLAAYCQSDGAPAALVSSDQLRGFLQDYLPDEWIPAVFVPLDRFPLTADGRLDEAALPVPVDPPAQEGGDTHDVPYLTLHHQIIEIWREVLNVRTVRIRDDFFALGGNSLLAMRMLYQLEQAFGKALLPSTLFERATVEHLADEILKHEEGTGSRELVRIQEEGARTPIFYLHGDISGGGFYCVKLSQGLGLDQPFYALPPVEVENPLTDRPTVEEMAAAHVATIRSVRPHGPYVVGGFCLGGLIAYEVACQLERQGETVERLLVIDADPEDRRLAKLRRVVEFVARWRGLDANRQLYLFCRWHYRLARWDRFRRLDSGTRRAAFSRKLSGLLQRRSRDNSPPANASAVAGPVDAATAWFDPRLDVPLVFLWAVGGYRTKPYSGDMTLLLSADLIGGAESGNPTRAWQRYVPALKVMELAGAHLACITEHVASLAHTIHRCLEHAD